MAVQLILGGLIHTDQNILLLLDGLKSHVSVGLVEWTNAQGIILYTVELRWLEPLWDHENLFETAVVWATEGYY